MGLVKKEPADSRGYNAELRQGAGSMIRAETTEANHEANAARCWSEMRPGRGPGKGLGAALSS